MGHSPFRELIPTRRQRGGGLRGGGGAGGSDAGVGMGNIYCNLEEISSREVKREIAFCRGQGNIQRAYFI